MHLSQEKTDVSSNTDLFFSQLGKMALLAGTAENFRTRRMDFGLSLIHAALVNGTYAIYVDNEGKPAAGLIWAYLNEANVNFYLDHATLPDLSAWRSGSELWLLNVVAEGGIARDIFKDAMENIFTNDDEAFMLRPRPNGTRRVVRITRSGTSVFKVLDKPKPE